MKPDNTDDEALDRAAQSLEEQAAGIASLRSQLGTLLPEVRKTKRGSRIAVGTAVVAVLAAVVAVVGVLQNRGTTERLNRTTERLDRQDTEQEVAGRERRISATAQRYSQCIDGNARVETQDKSLQDLTTQALARPEPVDAERTSRGLDGFRDGLLLSDCESILGPPVTPEEAAEARKRAGLFPRLPLPPPTIPGYVPPS